VQHAVDTNSIRSTIIFLSFQFFRDLEKEKIAGSITIGRRGRDGMFERQMARNGIAGIFC
jgi:hypothetical protein